ncbi:unnamed protein product, partial [Mesorhabditis belari]|uniref:C-type lectin domain-containing protein n=1 Tax=Mesorhabditis belari TaxID=2138241 RepID=A0AAF3JBC4_9BILA
MLRVLAVCLTISWSLCMTEEGARAVGELNESLQKVQNDVNKDVIKSCTKLSQGKLLLYEAPQTKRYKQLLEEKKKAIENFEKQSDRATDFATVVATSFLKVVGDAPKDLVSMSKSHLDEAAAAEQKQFQELIEGRTALGELVGKMESMDLEHVDLHKVIEVLGEAMEYLQKVRRQWNDLVQFFDDIRKIIDQNIIADNLKNVLENMELLREDSQIDLVILESTLRLVSYCIQVGNSARLYQIVSEKHITSKLRYVADRLTLDKVKAKQRKAQTRREGILIRISKYIATFFSMSTILKMSTWLLLVMLIIPSLCSYVEQYENVVRSLELQRTFLLQKREYRESSYSFKELLLDLREMVEADDYDTQVLKQIDVLVPRLQEEKIEVESFLKKIDDQRLAISNERSVLEQQKRVLENDLTEISRKLQMINEEYHSHLSHRSQLQSDFDYAKDRIHTAVRRAKQRAPSWAKWAWPIVIGVDEISGKGDLTAMSIRLGTIDMNLHEVRATARRVEEKRKVKDAHKQELDSKIETLDKNIHTLLTIHRQLSDWSHHLNQWIRFLIELIPRGTLLQENVLFGNEKLINKSLIALKNSLTESGMSVTLEKLIQSVDKHLGHKLVSANFKHCLDECLNGWSSFSSSCYKVFERKLIHSDAESYCQQEEAHLVSIHNFAENSFVFRLSKDTGSWWTWIGLQRNSVDRARFEWTDGSSVHFTHWSPNEPNQLQETAVAMNLRHPDLLKKWNDLPSGDTSHTPIVFVCKKPRSLVCS